MAVSSAKRKPAEISSNTRMEIENAQDVISCISEVVKESEALTSLYFTASPAQFGSLCMRIIGILGELSDDADLLKDWLEEDDSDSAAAAIACTQLQEAWESARQTSLTAALLADRKRKSLRMWLPSGDEKAIETERRLIGKFDYSFHENNDSNFYD